ncbi:unnamed protein product, partial [Phaeothamnion confervicola]
AAGTAAAGGGDSGRVKARRGGNFRHIEARRGSGGGRSAGRIKARRKRRRGWREWGGGRREGCRNGSSDKVGSRGNSADHSAAVAACRGRRVAAVMAGAAAPLSSVTAVAGPAAVAAGAPAAVHATAKNAAGIPADAGANVAASGGNSRCCDMLAVATTEPSLAPSCVAAHDTTAAAVRVY